MLEEAVKRDSITICVCLRVFVYGAENSKRGVVEEIRAHLLTGMGNICRPVSREFNRFERVVEWSYSFSLTYCIM